MVDRFIDIQMSRLTGQTCVPRNHSRSHYTPRGKRDYDSHYTRGLEKMRFGQVILMKLFSC